MNFSRCSASDNITDCVKEKRLLQSCVAAYCEVTLGVIPVSLRRFAYDARYRCHSHVWLLLDGDSSVIPFLTRWATEPGARASP